MKRDKSGKPFFDYAMASAILRAQVGDEIIEFIYQARSVALYAARLECDLADEKRRNETLEREAEMLKELIDDDHRGGDA